MSRKPYFPAAILLAVLSAWPASAGSFLLAETEGAIWVLQEGSEAAQAWRAGASLPEKHVTVFVSNEAGVQAFKSPDRETLRSFRASRPGYEVRVSEGATWIFRHGQAPDHLPEKHVTSIEAADGTVTTYKSTDTEALRGYRHGRPGFVTVSRDGHVWVLPADSPAPHGPFPEKHVTRLVAEEGLVTTYKSPDRLTLQTYLDVALHGGRPGYSVTVRDGKLWVFRADSLAALQAAQGHFPEKHVTTMQAGPDGVITYKAPDRLTLKGFAAARPGHVVRATADGPVWVFLPQSPELMAFDAGRFSEKHASRIVATEDGVVTLKADTMDILRGHAASLPGFVGRVRDGYLWIFAAGDPLLAEFDGGAELAKHVTSIVNQGGAVRSLKAPDRATLNAYQAGLPPAVG